MTKASHRARKVGVAGVRFLVGLKPARHTPSSGGKHPMKIGSVSLTRRRSRSQMLVGMLNQWQSKFEYQLVLIMYGALVADKPKS